MTKSGLRSMEMPAAVVSSNEPKCERRAQKEIIYTSMEGCNVKFILPLFKTGVCSERKEYAPLGKEFAPFGRIKNLLPLGVNSFLLM